MGGEEWTKVTISECVRGTETQTGDKCENKASLDEADLENRVSTVRGQVNWEAYLVCDVKGVVVGCEADVCLLLAVRSIEVVLEYAMYG